jgi:FkbM family methyltransferase
MMLRQIRRVAAEVLDRPGGRHALAFLATRLARRGTADDVGFVHDDVWLHRYGRTYLAASVEFSFRAGPDFARDFASFETACADFWFHSYTPKSGDVIVDVGAGKGVETLVFSRVVGPAGKVLSIEAHPQTFRLLDKLVKWNGLSNVIPLQCAVMDKPGRVSMDEKENHEANAVVQAAGDSGSWVPGETMDDLCQRQGIDRIDFLKMNIEGAERFALLGMTRMLERTRHICISCHDFLADEGGDPGCRTKAFVTEHLRANGFEIISRDDDPRPYVACQVNARRRDLA